MSVITISRGSYSYGKEVAEKVANKLGFECISREVIVEASEEFNVPEIRLLHAVRDAPSILDRFTFGKEKYIAYVRAALLSHFQKDNVVYHGLAGHFLVKRVSHVLKVRIIADLDDRARLMEQREGLSKERALRRLRDIDEARRKWSLYLYGIDTHDPSLYDLVLHLGKITADDAVDLISHTASSDRFQATADSHQVIDDLLLAARVKAVLVKDHHRPNVSAWEGSVDISLPNAGLGEKRAIQKCVENVPGVQRVTINVYPFTTPD